jgi:hypothetical protein
MHPDDAKSFVEKLEDTGLRLLGDDGFADIAIVGQRRGPSRPCTWLRFGQHFESGTLFCELASAPTGGEIATPPGWHPNELRHSDDCTGLEHVRTGGGLQEYRDPSTGRLVYVGRATGHSGTVTEPR